MEIKQETILDSGTFDGCFSVRKQKYIEVEEQRNYIGQPERRAFVPGEFDALKEFAPEFEIMMKTFWTPEIIDAWQRKQAEMQ